jgi:hypothetical protein
MWYLCWYLSSCSADSSALLFALWVGIVVLATSFDCENVSPARSMDEEGTRIGRQDLTTRKMNAPDTPSLSHPFRKYFRHLHASPKSIMTLNLRHLGSLSASDLAHLPHRINSLWIGPGFASPTTDVVQSLPTGLQQLDLDLTTAVTSIGRNVHQTEKKVIRLLFQRVMHLESLSLRIRGCAGVCAIAQNLDKATQLTTLDFRSNLMGDAGVQCLCQALVTSTKDRMPPLRHLVLSWNNITDVGVHALCQVLTSPTCQLETLDLSCNAGISDEGLSALCRALQINKSLHNLTLFSCTGITDAMPLQRILLGKDNDLKDVVELTVDIQNFTLKYVDLQGTPARAMDAAVEQIGLGLALNRAGRLNLRTQSDDISWLAYIPSMNDGSQATKVDSTKSVQWWRSASDLVHKQDPLQDLIVLFYFMRQTSSLWSRRKDIAMDEDGDDDRMSSIY